MASFCAGRSGVLIKVFNVSGASDFSRQTAQNLRGVPTLATPIRHVHKKSLLGSAYAL